jgi:hypothetical protein
MLDLVVWLWRVHRILRMLLLGLACRVRALRMFLEDMIVNVGVCWLRAELLRGVWTLLVRCTDDGLCQKVDVDNRSASTSQLTAISARRTQIPQGVLARTSG